MITSDSPGGKFGNSISVLQLDFLSIMMIRARSYMHDSEISDQKVALVIASLFSSAKALLKFGRSSD